MSGEVKIWVDNFKGLMIGFGLEHLLSSTSIKMVEVIHEVVWFNLQFYQFIKPTFHCFTFVCI